MKKAASSLRRSPGSGPAKKDALFKPRDVVVMLGVLAMVVAGVYGMTA